MVTRATLMLTGLRKWNNSRQVISVMYLQYEKPSAATWITSQQEPTGEPWLPACNQPCLKGINSQRYAGSKQKSKQILSTESYSKKTEQK